MLLVGACCLYWLFSRHTPTPIVAVETPKPPEPMPQNPVEPIPTLPEDFAETASEVGFEIPLEVNKKLQPDKSVLSCDDVRKKLAETASNDYQTRSQLLASEDQKSAIYLNPKTGVLSACVNDQAFAAKLFEAAELEANLGGDSGQELRLEPGSLRDFNADGKLEFLLFSGMCDDGPCSGDRTLYQLDSGSVLELYKIYGDLVSWDSFEDPSMLTMTRICRTYDLEIVFGYTTVAKFQGSKLLQVRLPVAKKVYKKTYERLFSGDGPYAPIEDLVNRAYQGEPSVKLLAEFDAFKKGLAPSGDGGDNSIPIDCDARKIIETIARE